MKHGMETKVAPFFVPQCTYTILQWIYFLPSFLPSVSICKLNLCTLTPFDLKLSNSVQ